MLDAGNAAGYTDFRRIGSALVTIPRAEQMPAPPLQRNSSSHSMAAPSETFRATQKTLKAIAARFSPSGMKAHQEIQEPRRATLPAMSPSISVHGNPSMSSLSSVRSEPHVARSEPTLSPLSHRASFSMPNKRHPSQSTSQSANQHRNIDYLAFSASDSLAGHTLNPNAAIKTEVSTSDWEQLLSSLDNGQTNIYDTIYGGPPADALLDVAPVSASADSGATWSPNAWNWSSYGTEAPPQSVLSFSDESLTSGEEFGNASCEYNSTPGSDRMYAGIMIPDMGATSGLGGLDGNFGL